MDGFITPKDIVCPTCKAAKGARCTLPKRDGSYYIDNFHASRIKAAVDYNEKLCKDHGYPQQSTQFFRNYFSNTKV